jgi:hypothetical protein
MLVFHWLLILLFLFSLTESPNFKKLTCFLYSLPCSNAYVESAFYQMKFLLNDRRNCMTIELISGELNIRLNSTLSCTEIYKHIIDSQDLSKAIKSNEKYTFKKMCSIILFICLTSVFSWFCTIKLEFDVKNSYYHTDTRLKIVLYQKHVFCFLTVKLLSFPVFSK